MIRNSNLLILFYYAKKCYYKFSKSHSLLDLSKLLLKFSKILDLEFEAIKIFHHAYNTRNKNLFKILSLFITIYPIPYTIIFEKNRRNSENLTSKSICSKQWSDRWTELRDKTRHRVNRWRIERLFNRVVTSSKSSLWDEVVLIQISRSRALPVRTSRSPAIVTPDSAHLSTSREDTFGRFASFCVFVDYSSIRILCPNTGGKVNLLHELFRLARVHGISTLHARYI